MRILTCVLCAVALELVPSLAQGAWPCDPTINLPVCTSGGVWGAVAAPDGSGGAFVVWHDARDAAVSNEDVYAHHILASGELDPRWPADGLPISTAAELEQNPQVESDGAGGAIVSWSRSGPCYVDEYGEFACDLEGGSVRLQHVLASGDFDPAWPPDGLSVSLAGYEFNRHQMISDGAGGVLVRFGAWRTTGPEWWAIELVGLFVQHVTPAGIDPAWPPEGRRVYPTSEVAHEPSVELVQGRQVHSGTRGDDPFLVSDSDGGAIAILPNGLAQHVLASGQVDPTWPAEGMMLPFPPSTAAGWLMLPDGRGGLILTWGDNRRSDPNFDIYAQHLLSSGVVDPAWPVDGFPVCTAPGPQGNPVIVSDGAGGALVAWSDGRGGVGSNDIYAQHLLSSGAVDPAWPVDGRALCMAPNWQADVAMVSDGAGGAIVTWRDYRSLPPGQFVNPEHFVDLYAHHILRSGVPDPTWPRDGQAVCTAPEVQAWLTVPPVVVSDRKGGAIIAWNDGRNGKWENGKWDLYAQRVTRHGELGSPGSSVAATQIESADFGPAEFADTSPKPGSPPKLSFTLASPNPTTGPAMFRLAQPQPTRVRLAIYDAAGRQVRTVAQGWRGPGYHVLEWDLRDALGAEVPRGLYFARLETEQGQITRRLAKL